MRFSTLLERVLMDIFLVILAPTVQEPYICKGQVWRYGSTRKEENERYPGGNYGAPNIVFIPEFRGTIAECLRMEKIKIYNYPLLPEARAREFLLAIPPGNKIDN